MFDWVQNALPPLDVCYLCGLSSLCVHIVVPECFQNIISRLQYTRFFYKQSQAEIGKKIKQMLSPKASTLLSKNNEIYSKK